jgi:hypothetical protein
MATLREAIETLREAIVHLLHVALAEHDAPAVRTLTLSAADCARIAPVLLAALPRAVLDTTDAALLRATAEQMAVIAREANA